MADPQYALVAYVRNELGEFVENLRAELHPEHAHLPAHVSILPPRPLRGSESDAVEHLIQLCGKIEPFEISLGNVEAFLPTTTTVFIQISYAAYKLRELHDLLNSGGLEYHEPLPFMPHLTIAKVPSTMRCKEVFSRSRDRWDRYEGTRRALIDTVTFVRGNGYQWTDLAPIELGGRVTAPEL
jgi:2'-5' RNA ligase